MDDVLLVYMRLFDNRGCTEDLEMFDRRMKDAVNFYNEKHGTDHDPTEVLIRYLEQCERIEYGAT